VSTITLYSYPWTGIILKSTHFSSNPCGASQSYLFSGTSNPS